LKKITHIDNRGRLLYNIPVKYLKWTIPITAIFAILFVGLGIYITKADKPVQSAVNGSQVQIEPLNADKILSLVNAERAKVGVAPLVSDPRLAATAQSRADDMVARNYFSHFDPVTGESLVVIKPTNPQCITAGENMVWIKYQTPQENNREAVDWWLNSKAHHDAMLDSRYSLTGIGIKDNRIVQHFCQQ